MNFNKYRFGFIDLSYILMRNISSISKGKKIGEYYSSDVVRMTIQTLNKICRDYGISVDKFVFIRDQWSKEHKGYFRTAILEGDYKSTRVWVNRDMIAQMKADPNVSPEELEKAELKCYMNEVRTEAKRIIIEELCNFGLPTIGYEGYEFDDIAYIVSAMITSRDTKPSLIITKDSDLQYSLTPKVDFFKIPTGNSKPEIITYDQMYFSMPEAIRNDGRLSLYQYKAYMDSLGEGHNDMQKSRKAHCDPTTTILQILSGDYSSLQDTELFLKQLSTFNIENFPHFQDVQKMICDSLGVVGKLGKLEDFQKFRDKYGMNISDKYYSEFINRFDPILFQS